MDTSAYSIECDTGDPAVRARHGRAASKSWRRQTNRAVLNARAFEHARQFLPDGLTLANELEFLPETQVRLWSQVQARTYVSNFGLIGQSAGGRLFDRSRVRGSSDDVELEALVRFGDGERRRRSLLRQVEAMFAAHMPPGYVRTSTPSEVARLASGRCTWAVLALTCHLELLAHTHYRQSFGPDGSSSALFAGMLRRLWRETRRHALLVELQWRREDAQATLRQKDRAVEELVELLLAVDEILQVQAAADTRYFIGLCPDRAFTPSQQARLGAQMQRAYRWQFIVSGVRHPHYQRVFEQLTTPVHRSRLTQAIRPILGPFPVGQVGNARNQS